MSGSDPRDLVEAVDGTADEDVSEVAGAVGADAAGDAGWALVAEYDGAASLLETVLELDAETAYTKTELSDASDVPYKNLYLEGTVEALVYAGLLESDERDGEETTFHVDPDSAVYEAAAAFDDAVRRRQQADPP